MGSVGTARETPKKPNVLIVMTDDQGLGDFSYTGNPVLKTPNLDAFARESVRLTDFHVAPMCSPTRGQLLSGLAALRNGVTSVTAGRTFLRPGITTMADIFSGAGYKTGLFGKWHLGDNYPHRPIDKGFGEALHHLGFAQLNSAPEFDWPLIDGRFFHNGKQGRYKGHATDVWFNAAMDWMKKCKQDGEPFFCYLPTNAAHAPYIDLPKYMELYEGKGPAGFFGMIAHVDDRFGDLVKFLETEGLERDTVVIFMTDNGGTAGVKLYNAGLRGHKTQYYEGGHRVPCWIRWPGGGLGEPRDISVPTQNIDLLPTLCDFCEVKQPEVPAEDAPYRGTSLAALLRGGQELPERTIVVQYGQIPEKYDSCIIRGKWRLVHGKELYDVEADLAETTDVAKEHPEVVDSLRQYYDGWWKGVEPLLDEFVPTSLGAKEQPVVELTSADWENIYADNTGHVRKAVGGPTGGHWNVLVETPGTYEFTLRRWPERTGAALGSRYLPSAKSPPWYPKPKTVGFPSIARASVKIAGESASTGADPKAQSASLKATLPAGPAELKAWFSDASGQDLCGAFFVTVKRVK
jgi:arylsulfatase